MDCGERFDLKALQRKELSIAKTVLEIAKQNDINCFCIYGTVLGAIRHKGFIPWDDDLDVALLREDYERFIPILKENLPDGLEVIDANYCEHYPVPFAKVHDVNTTFVEKISLDFKDRYSGVFVDIFPLDKVPDNELFFNIYKLELKFWLDCNYAKKFEKYDRHKTSKLKFVYDLIDKWIKSQRSDYFLKKCESCMQKYNKRNFKRVGYAETTVAGVIYPKTLFAQICNYQFENTELPCPKDFDTYLKIEYGNYMQLPPEDQRHVHNNGGIIDLEKSFKYYQS